MRADPPAPKLCHCTALSTLLFACLIPTAPAAVVNFDDAPVTATNPGTGSFIRHTNTIVTSPSFLRVRVLTP